LPTQYKDFQTRKYQLKPRLPKTWLRKKDAWNSFISALEAVRDGFDQKRQLMKAAVWRMRFYTRLRSIQQSTGLR
jgi:hypothetical protein